MGFRRCRRNLSGRPAWAAAREAAGAAAALLPAVAVAARHGVSTGFEVQSEKGLDVRRHVAQAVVAAGYGLVELRPMRMSLEEIFLQLTTTDSPEEEVARA